MRNNKFLLAVAALGASALIAAGCGGDDDDDSSDEPVTTQETTTEAPEDLTVPTTGGDTGGEPVNPEDLIPQGAPANIDEAIDRCRDQANQLSGDQKDAANQICDQAEEAAKNLEGGN